MARRKQNGVFGFLTEKRETYRRDVAGERADRARAAKEDARRAKEKAAQLLAELKEDAYGAGQNDKRAGRKPTPYRITLVTSPRWEDAFGKQKARQLVQSAYNQGYRANPARKKGNPIDAAAELSEAWHGRAAKNLTDVIESVKYHGVLTELGRLQEIKILVTARKTQAIRFDAETMLCSSENGKQLYVVGGDQSLDLVSLGITGEEAEKDCVMVGEVYSLTYVTDKHHLGKADKIAGPYEHQMGEKGGVAPFLVYDRLNETVGFSGGTYVIDPTDYDGSHSAGIRN